MTREEYFSKLDEEHAFLYFHLKPMDEERHNKWINHIFYMIKQFAGKIFNDLEAQLKALKAENLAETEMFNKVVKTKDERIKELECRVYHAEGYVITHAENYRICDGCFYTLTIQASMEEIVRAQETCYSCQRYYSDKFRLKTIEE